MAHYNEGSGRIVFEQLIGYFNWEVGATDSGIQPDAAFDELIRQLKAVDSAALVSMVRGWCNVAHLCSTEGVWEFIEWLDAEMGYELPRREILKGFDYASENWWRVEEIPLSQLVDGV